MKSTDILYRAAIIDELSYLERFCGICGSNGCESCNVTQRKNNLQRLLRG
jgi:hypothetical protein